MGISLRQYAASRKARGLSGGTDTAVRKAVLAGRITKLPDGTVDPATADREWEGASDATRLRGDKPMASSKPQEVFRIEDENERPVIVASPTAGMDEKSAATLNQLKVAREKVKLKKEIREEKVAEKTYVARAPANQFVFELARSFLGEVESWPDTIGPEAAAEFGVDEHALVQFLRDKFRSRLERMAQVGTDVPVPK